MLVCDFSFRVWVYPIDGDPPDVEVWWHGLEPTGPGASSYTHWASESFANEDFYARFSLDPTKCWQVVGKARIRGSFVIGDEYDETIDILEYEKAEVLCRYDTDSDGNCHVCHSVGGCRFAGGPF